MSSISVFRLEKDQPQRRSGIEQGVSRGEPDDASSDYRDVVRYFAHD
jgi:hypothetical protein